jgi:hypothetical protein
VKKFDFGLGWTGEKEGYLFLQALRSECELRGIRFLLVDEKCLDSFTNDLEHQRVYMKFFLDLASETSNLEDPFTKLMYRLKDSGTRVVADPDKVRFFADKSITHYELLKADMPLPFTIIIRSWDPTKRLTESEKEKLGIPFVVKPASGYAQRGVKIIRKKASLREVAEARAFSPGDHFLLQEFIQPVRLGVDPAWFRVFYLFGEVIVCWWNTETGRYRQVTLKEFDLFHLSPLVRLASQIAEISEIEWFTCEIALNSKNQQFTVIDYVNDQFDVSSQSQRPAGVPDDVLLLLANRITEKVWHYIKGKTALHHRTVHFGRVKVPDEEI